MTKVLVVDDEHSQVEVLTMLLASEGFEVAAASNGREALDRLDDVKPDLILTDYMMPRMNGGEMAAKVRSTAYSRIPIIMTSATVVEKVEQHSDHYDAILRKPYLWDELFELIRTLLAGNLKTGGT